MANLKSAIKQEKLSNLKPNPDNPRHITEEKFEKLKKSITDFPQMLELRPIVVDQDMVILGGNMRYEACKALKIKEVPIVKAHDLTEEQKKEFIIKDNVGFGTWDWEALANEWGNKELESWGLDVWVPEQEHEVDYSLLDDEEDGELKEMEDGVMKAIQIEFEPDHYEEASKLIKELRLKLDNGYIGGFVLGALKEASLK